MTTPITDILTNAMRRARSNPGNQRDVDFAALAEIVAAISPTPNPQLPPGMTFAPNAATIGHVAESHVSARVGHLLDVVAARDATLAELRGEIERWSGCAATLRAEIHKLTGDLARATEDRDAEWQRRLMPLHVGYDGDGCDSGDPIDWSLAAIGIAQTRSEDERAELRADLARVTMERDDSRGSWDRVASNVNALLLSLGLDCNGSMPALLEKSKQLVADRDRLTVQVRALEDGCAAVSALVREAEARGMRRGFEIAADWWAGEHAAEEHPACIELRDAIAALGTSAVPTPCSALFTGDGGKRRCTRTQHGADTKHSDGQHEEDAVPSDAHRTTSTAVSYDTKTGVQRISGVTIDHRTDVTRPVTFPSPLPDGWVQVDAGTIERRVPPAPRPTYHDDDTTNDEVYIEHAYWLFDADRAGRWVDTGDGKRTRMPMAERDAFKGQMRALLKRQERPALTVERLAEALLSDEAIELSSDDTNNIDRCAGDAARRIIARVNATPERQAELAKCKAATMANQEPERRTAEEFARDEHGAELRDPKPGDAPPCVFCAAPNARGHRSVLRPVGGAWCGECDAKGPPLPEVQCSACKRMARNVYEDRRCEHCGSVVFAPDYSPTVSAPSDEELAEVFYAVAAALEAAGRRPVVPWSKALPNVKALTTAGIRAIRAQLYPVVDDSIRRLVDGLDVRRRSGFQFGKDSVLDDVLDRLMRKVGLPAEPRDPIGGDRV